MFLKRVMRASDKDYMNIRGLNRIHGFFGAVTDAKKRTAEASADRDSGSSPRHSPRRDVRLTPEQVDEAYESFIAKLQGTGLTAERSSNEEGFPVFTVRDPQGQVVRTLLHPAIVDIWFDRDTPDTSGQLLKKSA